MSQWSQGRARGAAARGSRRGGAGGTGGAGAGRGRAGRGRGGGGGGHLGGGAEAGEVSVIGLSRANASGQSAIDPEYFTRRNWVLDLTLAHLFYRQEANRNDDFMKPLQALCGVTHTSVLPRDIKVAKRDPEAANSFAISDLFQGTVSDEKVVTSLLERMHLSLPQVTVSAAGPGGAGGGAAGREQRPALSTGPQELELPQPGSDCRRVCFLTLASPEVEVQNHLTLWQHVHAHEVALFDSDFALVAPPTDRPHAAVCGVHPLPNMHLDTPNDPPGMSYEEKLVRQHITCCVGRQYGGKTRSPEVPSAGTVWLEWERKMRQASDEERRALETVNPYIDLLKTVPRDQRGEPMVQARNCLHDPHLKQIHAALTSGHAAAAAGGGGPIIPDDRVQYLNLHLSFMVSRYQAVGASLAPFYRWEALSVPRKLFLLAHPPPVQPSAQMLLALAGDEEKKGPLATLHPLNKQRLGSMRMGLLLRESLRLYAVMEPSESIPPGARVPVQRQAPLLVLSPPAGNLEIMNRLIQSIISDASQAGVTFAPQVVDFPVPGLPDTGCGKHVVLPVGDGTAGHFLRAVSTVLHFPYEKLLRSWHTPIRDQAVFLAIADRLWPTVLHSLATRLGPTLTVQGPHGDPNQLAALVDRSAFSFAGAGQPTGPAPGPYMQQPQPQPQPQPQQPHR